MNIDFCKLGSVQFSIPDRVSLAWPYYLTSGSYLDLTDELEAVYILRGINEEVLYVGHSEQLKKRLNTHLYGPHKKEILSIEYIAHNRINLRELEKILYYFLKPKYSNKKIVPHSLYRMKRISLKRGLPKKMVKAKPMMRD